MGIVVNVPQAGLDMVLYGDKSNVISNYLYQQMQAMPQAFNDFSQRVFNAMSTSYNYVNDKLTQYGILNKLQEADWLLSTIIIKNYLHSSNSRMLT